MVDSCHATSLTTQTTADQPGVLHIITSEGIYRRALATMISKLIRAERHEVSH